MATWTKLQEKNFQALLARRRAATKELLEKVKPEFLEEFAYRQQEDRSTEDEIGAIQKWFAPEEILEIIEMQEELYGDQAVSPMLFARASG